MIKQLILLIQVFGLFFYQLLFTGDLTVTQKLPESITQGNEAIVEITIKKNDITGFAKVQQLFPAGFTAEPVETKGATFSFKDNKVKFIWMALPADNEFTISYKIKPNQTTLGDFAISGKFSFISESERKNIDIPEAKFSVVSEAIAVEDPLVEDVTVPEEEVIAEEVEETVIEEVVEELPIIEEPVTEIIEESTIEEPVEEIVEEVVEESTTEEFVEEVVAEAVEEPTPELPVEESVIEIITIECNRIIKNLENGKFNVTVEIDKKGIQGFAKITESIPEGFVATENDSKSGVFSFRENELKILWMAIPKDEKFSISYDLEAAPNTSNATYSIKGYFSYLENDVTSKYNIDGSSFELNVEQMVVEEPVVEEIVEEVIEEELVVEDPVVEEIVEEEAVVENVVEEEPVIVEEPVVADNTKTTITSTPNPDTGVTYKVQVGAGHKTVSSNYFEVKFNLQDNVSTINHEGWIKYLVGSFNEYKLARDKRNSVRNNVKTAFVTAYNSGKRITVQEALMISNQKWYK